MEEEVDVRLVEIIYFDVVDCQLLFLVTQLLPLALRLGDVLLGKLRDAVVFVPEQLELLVDSFLFLFPGIGQSHPFVIFDDAYVQGCIVGVGMISMIPRVASPCMKRKVFPVDQWRTRLQSR